VGRRADDDRACVQLVGVRAHQAPDRAVVGGVQQHVADGRDTRRRQPCQVVANQRLRRLQGFAARAGLGRGRVLLRVENVHGAAVDGGETARRVGDAADAMGRSTCEIDMTAWVVTVLLTPMNTPATITAAMSTAGVVVGGARSLLSILRLWVDSCRFRVCQLAEGG
jgi:hypothetical protein